jgi:MoaA/NifB/PqqE/SkfB family radical SAM enzyme
MKRNAKDGLFTKPSLIPWQVKEVSCASKKITSQETGHVRPTISKGTSDHGPGNRGRFIRQVADVGPFQMLAFTGGEPVFRREIDELLHCSKRHGLVNVIATNGTLIDSKRAAELKKLGVKGIAVSFDSTDEDVHNYIRRHPNAFDLAPRAINACKQSGTVVQLNYTAMNENLSTLEEVVRFCHKIRADIMLCYQLVPMGRGQQIVDSTLSPLQNEQLVKTLRKLQRDSVTIVEPLAALQYWPCLLKRDNSHPKSVARSTLFHGCAAGWGLVYVKPNGDVWPCPFVPIHGGNVREVPLSRVWKHGDVFRMLRDSIHLWRLPGQSLCRRR